MKLNINKNDLLQLVIPAERNSSKNPTLPILSTILLKASKNILEIISTNLEVGFEARLAAKTDSVGEVAVPARPLLQLLASISGEELTIESTDHNLSLTSKNSSTNLKCFPPDDFPVLPKIKKENFFRIPAATLVRALKNTSVAAALSSVKPELASIFIFSQNKIPLTFAATDSFRLAEYRTDIVTEPASFLLPQKSAQEVLRIFEESEEEIEVAHNKNQILFISQNSSFTSRLTEANFPDYKNIIPKSFLTQVVMERAHILGAIKAASVFSSRLSDVILKVNNDENILEVSAKDSDMGEHHSVAPANITGEDIEISFNYRYLLDALGVATEPKVFLGFNGPGKAVLIKGQNESSYLELVMPMRTV